MFGNQHPSHFEVLRSYVTEDCRTKSQFEMRLQGVDVASHLLCQIKCLWRVDQCAVQYHLRMHESVIMFASNLMNQVVFFTRQIHDLKDELNRVGFMV